MPTLNKAESSRVNGAKSHGPITPAGKAKCSRGALKHGLTATTHAVLDVEDPTQFQLVLDAALDEFRPATHHTVRLVEKLALLDWRIERAAMIETVANLRRWGMRGLPR